MRRRALVFAPMLGVALLASVALAVLRAGGASSPPAAPAAPSTLVAVVETPTPSPTPEATPQPIAFDFQVWPERPSSIIVPVPAPPAPVLPPPVAVSRIEVPRLGLSAPIEGVGVSASGEMGSPSYASSAVGWYVTFDLPGAGGNSVFSAHETWNHQPAPFYWLHRMVPGDELSIEMADGSVYRYVVFSNIRYQLDNMPIEAIIWPSTRGAGEEWVTLITCGGRIVYDATGYGEYLDRDVVVARRIA